MAWVKQQASSDPHSYPSCYRQGWEVALTTLATWHTRKKKHDHNWLKWKLQLARQTHYSYRVALRQRKLNFYKACRLIQINNLCLVAAMATTHSILHILPYVLNDDEEVESRSKLQKMQYAKIYKQSGDTCLACSCAQNWLHRHQPQLLSSSKAHLLLNCTFSAPRWGCRSAAHKLLFWRNLLAPASSQGPSPLESHLTDLSAELCGRTPWIKTPVPSPEANYEAEGTGENSETFLYW